MVQMGQNMQETDYKQLWISSYNNVFCWFCFEKRRSCSCPRHEGYRGVEKYIHLFLT
jgi:hypothetical protein